MLLPADAVLPALNSSTSVLDTVTKPIIQAGVSALSGTVVDVLSITIPTVVAVLALTVGVNFAMSKIRSVASWAS